jgi:hypothetical protein
VIRTPITPSSGFFKERDCTCDDEHIIALALVSRARLLCNNDQKISPIAKPSTSPEKRFTETASTNA